MEMRLRNSLLNEEERTVKWFLWIFYSIYFLYEVIYSNFLPDAPWYSESIPLTYNLDYLFHLIMISLLPLSLYLIKRNKTGWIKYIYFITFTFANIFQELFYYMGNETSYASGNVVEIVIVLFSPIFVNKKFFYLVSLGTLAKFIIIGLVLQDLVVLMPFLIVVVLSIIAFILLHRFLGYVSAVKNSYDKQLEGMVKGVIATIELKDPYTRGHSERVADYAASLARATGKYREEELKSFYYVCLLHDIGKVHIPDAILSKAGRLTAEEFEIVKTHPQVGAEAVRKVEGIDNNIDVIYHHHERWDGTGYPDNLKGKEIPFLARVVALADAFDAMTSSRSYRAALPAEEAYRRILEGKGTQFDPELVDLFTEVYPEWRKFHPEGSRKDEALERITNIDAKKEVRLHENP